MSQFKVGDEVEVALCRDGSALYFGEYGSGEYPEDCDWVCAKVLVVTGLHYIVGFESGGEHRKDGVMLENQLERSRGEWPSIRPRQPKDTLLSDLRTYLKEQIGKLEDQSTEALAESDHETACYLDGQIVALEDVLVYLADREDQT